MPVGFQPRSQFLKVPQGSQDREDRISMVGFDQEPELRPIPNMAYNLLFRLQYNEGTDLAPGTGNVDSITSQDSMK